MIRTNEDRAPGAAKESSSSTVYEQRRSILIDLPGHGASGKPDVAYSPERFAQAVEGVLRDAGVKRAVLVGHSMGVMVSMAFLRRYPGLVSGLVFVDGGGLMNATAG